MRAAEVLIHASHPWEGIPLVVQTPDADFVETVRPTESIPNLECTRGFCGDPAARSVGDPMNVQSCPWPAAVALALAITLSGCAIGTPASGDSPSSADRKKDRKDKKAAARTRKAPAASAPNKAPAAPKPTPKPEPRARAGKTTIPAQSKPEALRWTCSWSPTFDDDAHNDVECANGIATERPYLRAWDDDVQRWELMASAREYAQERTAG